jgi:hypothetical protein
MSNLGPFRALGAQRPALLAVAEGPNRGQKGSSEMIYVNFGCMISQTDFKQ